MPPVKRLMIFRHAKSDWDADYRGDHDRPLNRRGAAAAATMGMVVARAGEVPDRVISSSAVRARTTAELAMAAGDWHCALDLTDALYGTSAAGALRVASTTEPEVERLMLVGHQPTWGSLVEILTGAPVRIRTATLVAIDLTISSWARASASRGEIAYALQPRMFDPEHWPELHQ